MAKQGVKRRPVPSARGRIGGQSQGEATHVLEATRNTLRGLAAAWQSEAAFRQEVVALLLALPVGLFLAPSAVWYVAMIGSLIAVLAVELLNTATEKLADHVAPEQHPAVGRAKDFGSAAVACALLLAGLIWLAALAVRAGLF